MKVSFGVPYLGPEEEQAVQNVIRSRWIGNGPQVKAFEKELAEYVGAAHVVAVSSCTAALHLALLVSGVRPGDDVIVPAMTFCATAEAVRLCGARPVFADIDPETWLIDLQSAEDCTTGYTSAIIPVHYAASVVDMNRFRRLAANHGLRVIEDAAHAVGALYPDGKRVGSLPDGITCFSFFPTKHIASPDGGALVWGEGLEACESEVRFAQLKALRHHGLRKDAFKQARTGQWVLSELVGDGYKYNWNDLAASVARVQLRRQNELLTKRGEIFAAYDQVLEGMEGIQLQAERGVRQWYYYVVKIDPAIYGPRDAIVAELMRRGVGCGVHYQSLTAEPLYARDWYGSCPVAEELGARCLTLPVHPGMGADDVVFVLETFLDVLEGARR